MAKIYDFTVKDRGGASVSLGDYAGKVLLIVNTATGCGFTPHYEPLEAMYRDLRDKGFEILDFPCNQFANQAPGNDEEIHQFCTMKFGTEFPQFAKIDVNGESAVGLTESGDNYRVSALINTYQEGGAPLTDVPAAPCRQDISPARILKEVDTLDQHKAPH